MSCLFATEAAVQRESKILFWKGKYNFLKSLCSEAFPGKDVGLRTRTFLVSLSKLVLHEVT